MATDPPQAENLGYWLRRLRDQDRQRRGMKPTAQALVEPYVQDAPRSSEEEGIVEDDWELYAQHPSEHTLREGP